MHTLRFKSRHLLIALLCGVFGTSSLAAELAVGDPAPAFTLQGSDGKLHQLQDYRGKTVVLAWFPKAFTGG
jgi:thioredoxin-dependent peroxiredoxin